MAKHYHGERVFKDAVELQTEGTDPAHAVTKRYVDGRTETATHTDIIAEIDPASIVPAPPAGTIFTTQAEVDAYLAANSGTAFEYIMDYVDTVPEFVAHSVIVSMLAGVHRPRAGDTTAVIELFKTKAISGHISFQGVPIAEWDTIHAGGTIRDHQNLKEVTGTEDPYIDCDPATFPNDNSLAGSYAVFDNGYFGIVWKHTDTRLWLIRTLSPSPVDDITTVFVMRPATIIRNSIDDVVRHATYTYEGSVGADGLGRTVAGDPSTVAFMDLLIQDFGSSYGMMLTEAAYAFDRVLNDKTYGAAAENGRFARVWWGAKATFFDCSLVGSLGVPGTDGGLQVMDMGARGVTAWIYTSYFQGGGGGGMLYAQGIAVALAIYNCVCRGGGGSGSSWDVIGTWGARINIGLAYGVMNTVDADQGSYGALSVQGSISLDFAWGSRLRIMNSQGPCVRILEDTSAFLLWSKILDGGGNADVGFSIVGPKCKLEIDSGTDVTGALGDVKFDHGGETFTYAEVTADGPIIDSVQNLVRRS